EVRLREHTVDPRPAARLVLLPRLRVRQRAHAGAHELAVRQHDFETAVRIEMIAELRPRVPAAAIERVAKRAAPARIGHVDPHLELALLDVAIEVEVADA